MNQRLVTQEYRPTINIWISKSTPKKRLVVQHWVLDVTFREDDSRIRPGYAPENFNIFRQLGINMLKRNRLK